MRMLLLMMVAIMTAVRVAFILKKIMIVMEIVLRWIVTVNAVVMLI